MNNITRTLLAAATVTVCTAPAFAMPVAQLSDALPGLKQDVRIICHYGRCYEARRAARYYSYDEGYYAPRAYYGGPGYGYYGGPSIGFSFGFGGHHRGW